MKNHTLILFLFLLPFINSCKKDTELIKPRAVINIGLNLQEKALLGKWVLRKEVDHFRSEIYFNYYDSTNYFLDLKGEPSKVVDNAFLCQGGLFGGGSNNRSVWKIDTTQTPNILVLGAGTEKMEMTILFSTADSLVIGDFFSYNQYRLFIFNKTNYACVPSSKELLISKNWIFGKTDNLDASGNVTTSVTYYDPSLYFLNLGISWNNLSWFGWKCNSGQGSPLADYIVWELTKNDSNVVFDGFVNGGILKPLLDFKIDTLSSNSLVFNSYKPGVGGQRHYLH